jgi:serine/threonine-protein kinase
MGSVDVVVRRDGGFARLFAQKRLRPHLVDDEAVRRMFLEEGRIAGLVRHPHVVSVVDVGEDDAGPYLVMDFVEGVSLADLLVRTSGRREPVPMPVALRIGAEIAAGLHAVHETVGPDGQPLELIHRDISPQNVLVGFDGLARVTDFGIAKALGRCTRTTTGVLKGKLGYLAPERLRFEEPDRRADLFSFGVVLFELLAGRRLYDTADEEGARRILNEPPPDLADHRDDAEPELIELLFELLAKDPEARPAHAGLVARRLEQLSAAAVAAHGPTDTGAHLARLFARERAALRERLSKIALGAPAPSRRASRSPAWLRRSALVSGAVAVAVLAITAAAHTPAGRQASRPGAEPVGPRPAATGAIPSAKSTPRDAVEGGPGLGAPAAMTSDSSPLPAAVALRPPRRSRTISPARTAASERPRAVRASAAPDGCDPPYTVNAAGERQFKLRCLVDVRR